MKKINRRCLLGICVILILVIPTTDSILSTSLRKTIHSIQYENDCYLYEESWNIYDDKLQAIPTVSFQIEELSSGFVGSNSHQESNDGLMNSSWPMSCHDTYHTSQSPISTENNPGTEKWRFKTSIDAGTVESGAVIDNNGIVYFGSMGGDHYLYALYPNGTLQWKYHVPGVIWSTPAIANDGTIYVGDWDGHLSALNQNGSLKWQIYRSGEFHSSPAIGDDGTIYLGHSSGNLYAINPDGSEKWLYDAGDKATSDPAIGEDGTIYIGSGDNYLYAINPNGTLRWRYLTGGVIKGHPSIAPDGTVYIPSFDGFLYALNPDGTLIWKVNTGEEVAAASAAIATDGTLYVGTEVLRAFNPNGTLKWSLDVGGDVYGTSPALSADGTIYVSAGVCIVAVNPDGTIKWKKLISNVAVKSSPCIDENSSIYVGSSWRNHDGTLTWGYLHAFGDAPLSIDAGGPYSGYALEPISFMCTTFGGALPYTFHWEFGDGNESNIEHPTHIYSRPGEYITTLTLIDGEGNSSSDNANVCVGTSLPTIRIQSPENALYFFNYKLFPLKRPVIIGKITIKVEAKQEDVGIREVIFFINTFPQFTDTEEPYEWTWTDKGFGIYDLAVGAYSNDNRWAWIGLDVCKFF